MWSAASDVPSKSTQVTWRSASCAYDTVIDAKSQAALTNATPVSSGRAAYISDLACAMFSRLPKSSIWLSPTLVMRPHCGLHERAEACDLAGSAHADFDNYGFGVGCGVEHGPRNAQLVVLVGLRGYRAERRCQNVAHEVFGGGLSRRPGDADDASAQMRAPCARQIGDAFGRIVYEDDESALIAHGAKRIIVKIVLDDGASCPVGHGGRHEGRAVDALARVAPRTGSRA
jgi:hypothetical protein